MKRLSPALLGVALVGLASTVNATLAYHAAGLLMVVCMGFYPALLLKPGWIHVLVYTMCIPDSAAVVGAAGGILLGVWLTRRLVTARTTS